MDDRLRVLLVGLMPFPEGGASTSRLRSLALGLRQAGAEVGILAFASDSVPQNSPGIEQVCAWRDVPCWLYRASPNPEKDQGITVRRVLRRLAGERLRSDEMGALYARLEELCSNRTVDAILFYNQEPDFALRLVRLCRFFGVCFVQQYAEFQLPSDYPEGVLSPLYLRQQFHMRLVPPRSDGNLVISTYLQERCHQAGARSTLLVPALTSTGADPGLVCATAHKEHPFTFTYLGKGARRDCLDMILEAAARVEVSVRSWQLQLVGLSAACLTSCAESIHLLRLGDRAKLAGWLSEERLQQAMALTDAFLLLRPDDRSSWACFPTRLPEFLALAKPVILSAVRDFPLYFTSGENALLVAPGDSGALAKAMLRLATDPDLARRLGTAGHRLCHETFGYGQHGGAIREYLARICHGDSPGRPL